MTRLKNRSLAKKKRDTSEARRMETLSYVAEATLKVERRDDPTRRDVTEVVQSQPILSTSEADPPRESSLLEKIFFEHSPSDAMKEAIKKFRDALEKYEKACTHHKSGTPVDYEILKENPACSCLAMHKILETTAKTYNLPYSDAFLPSRIEPFREYLKKIAELKEIRSKLEEPD